MLSIRTVLESLANWRLFRWLLPRDVRRRELLSRILFLLLRAYAISAIRMFRPMHLVTSVLAATALLLGRVRMTSNCSLVTIYSSSIGCVGYSVPVGRRFPFGKWWLLDSLVMGSCVVLVLLDLWLILRG